MPEDTIPEKLVRLRYMHNLEREEFADLLNFHWSTVQHWEIDGVMPKPESILKLCNYYKVPLNYFHEYYNIYYNVPGDKIRKWKEKNNYTYKDCYSKLDITHSCFGRLLNGRINLSYDMYLKLKEIGAL